MFRAKMSLWAISFILAFLCSKPAPYLRISDQDLQALLPPPGWSDQWKRHFDTQAYKGDDLFVYINGGAEIYHEYGFKQVLVQDFQNPAGKSISLEIYEMSQPDSAYGIYTFKKSQEGKRMEIGAEAYLEGYYMNFWKGNFLVTLTGFDEDQQTVVGLSALAQEVEKRIPSSSQEPPPLIKVLPPEGLISSSIKYLKGHLALFNCYPFSQKDIFKLKNGVRGSYNNGNEIYIFSYQTALESTARFAKAVSYFQQSPKFKVLAHSKNSVHMQTPEKQDIYLFSALNGILIVRGDISPDKACELNRKLQSRIREHLMIKP